MYGQAVGILLITGLLVLAWGYARVRDGSSAWLLLKRFGAMVPTSLAYVTMFTVAMIVELANGGGQITLTAAVAGGLAVVTSWCGSWYMNDIYDIDADKHSEEDRATADGRLTMRQTTAAAVGLCGASLAFAALINLYAVAATAAMIGLNLVYSIPPLRLKASGIGSMVSLGLMGAAAVFVGSAVVSSVPGVMTLRLAGVVTLMMAINLSYTDLKDEENDAQAGVENFVVQFGREPVRRFLMVSLPVSYIGGALVLGVTNPLALLVIALLGLVATTLLVTHDAAKPALVYRLDIVNSLYLVSITATYYFAYLG